MTRYNDSLGIPFGGVPISDQDLIQEFFSGNEDGFTVLLDRYLPLVYRFVYRYVGNADDANDIVQETFVKAWKHLRKFDKKRTFTTWLFTIAKNTALDFLKKKKAVPFSRIEEGDVDLDAFLAPYLAPADHPDDALARKDDAAELATALATLTPAYRTVLAMRYRDHLKFREIAEVLGEPIDTIKSKHRRGLIMLRKALGI